MVRYHSSLLPSSSLRQGLYLVITKCLTEQLHVSVTGLLHRFRSIPLSWWVIIWHSSLLAYSFRSLVHCHPGREHGRGHGSTLRWSSSGELHPDGSAGQGDQALAWASETSKPTSSDILAPIRPHLPNPSNPFK